MNKVVRILAFLLSFIMLLSLCACGDESRRDDDSDEDDKIIEPAPEPGKSDDEIFDEVYEIAMGMIRSGQHHDAYDLLYEIRHIEKAAEMLKDFKALPNHLEAYKDGAVYITQSLVDRGGGEVKFHGVHRYAVPKFSYDFYFEEEQLKVYYNYVEGGGSSYCDILEYDDEYRKIKRVGSSLTFQYKYDEKGNLVEETYGNSKQTYAYDEQNRLVSSVWDSGHSVITYNYEYNQNGDLVRQLRNGKVWIEKSYDAEGRITCEKQYSGANGALSAEKIYTYNVGEDAHDQPIYMMESKIYEYGFSYYRFYNEAGDILGISTAPGDEWRTSFEYDEQNRLVAVKDGYREAKYIYNEAGELVKIDIVNGDSKMEYNYSNYGMYYIPVEDIYEDIYTSLLLDPFAEVSLYPI